MTNAVHSEVAHKMSLPLPVGACFALFTPIGEKNWVPGWQPRFLWPADGRTQKGMVFLTGQGVEETYWTVVDFDEGGHYVRYCRLTPASRSVMVEVRCVATGPESTEVEVRYALTGHNEAGNETVRAFAQAYPGMIEEWRTLILKWLARKT